MSAPPAARASVSSVASRSSIARSSSPRSRTSPVWTTTRSPPIQVSLIVDRAGRAQRRARAAEIAVQIADRDERAWAPAAAARAARACSPVRRHRRGRGGRHRRAGHGRRRARRQQRRRGLVVGPAAIAAERPEHTGRDHREPDRIDPIARRIAAECKPAAGIAVIPQMRGSLTANPTCARGMRAVPSSHGLGLHPPRGRRHLARAVRGAVPPRDAARRVRSEYDGDDLIAKVKQLIARGSGDRRARARRARAALRLDRDAARLLPRLRAVVVGRRGDGRDAAAQVARHRRDPDPRHHLGVSKIAGRCRARSTRTTASARWCRRATCRRCSRTSRASSMRCRRASASLPAAARHPAGRRRAGPRVLGRHRHRRHPDARRVARGGAAGRRDRAQSVSTSPLARPCAIAGARMLVAEHFALHERRYLDVPAA